MIVYYFISLYYVARVIVAFAHRRSRDGWIVRLDGPNFVPMHMWNIWIWSNGWKGTGGSVVVSRARSAGSTDSSNSPHRKCHDELSANETPSSCSLLCCLDSSFSTFIFFQVRNLCRVRLTTCISYCLQFHVSTVYSDERRELSGFDPWLY